MSSLRKQHETSANSGTTVWPLSGLTFTRAQDQESLAKNHTGPVLDLEPKPFAHTSTWLRSILRHVGPRNTSVSRLGNPQHLDSLAPGTLLGLLGDQQHERPSGYSTGSQNSSPGSLWGHQPWTSVGYLVKDNSRGLLGTKTKGFRSQEFRVFVGKTPREWVHDTGLVHKNIGVKRRFMNEKRV